MTDVAIERPVLTTMVTLGAVVLGLMAVGRLGLDLFPDTSFPIVSIVTPYPGASPSEVEERVTKEIEERVASINGVDTVRSYSRDSRSTIIVQFDLDVDIRRAVSDVRDQVSLAVGELPQDVWSPIISRFDPTALPVLTYAVSSAKDPTDTREMVDKDIRPFLESIDGVATVSIEGGSDREIQVMLDASKLERNGLSVAAVAQILGSESFDVPSGRVDLGTFEQGVKASGRFQTLDELRDMVLVKKPDGVQVRVRDVATVVDGVEETRTLTRVDGKPAVTFQVQKQGGSNTVEVVDLVEAQLGKLQKNLPQDVVIKKVIDSSSFVRTNIDNLWHHLIIGGLMAVLVIYFFMLDWRSTVISALALPTSVVATFFVMWQLGFTLNIMSMMGLTLAIGILIDDSVVVRENIFRHMENGADPRTAAREGTREIAPAVIATTLTIVAVFVPVAFTGGLIGGFFREFGLTVAAAVVISLLVSFTLDPMLSARVAQEIPPDYHERQRKRPLVGWLVRLFDAGDRGYEKMLRWVMRHPIITIAATVVVFFGSLSLAPLMGQEFAGRGDRGEFEINVELPAGTSLSQTEKVVDGVEDVLWDVEYTRTVATTIGPNEEVNKARLRVIMTKKDQRTKPLSLIMEDLRGELSKVPGLQFNMREAGLGDSSMEEKPITLYVRGPDYDELAALARRVLNAIESTPGARDAVMDFSPGATEQRIFVSRERAADRGVSFGAVASTLRTALTGSEVTKVKRNDEDVTVRVQLRPGDRASIDDLKNLTVPDAKGQPVRLSEIIEMAPASTPSTIERMDRQRQISITANVYDRSLGEVLTDLQGRLDKLDAPPGYTFDFAGEAERMQETFANLGLAMGLAILFIYFVLASQFESFIHPLTIMIALPLAIVGAILALFLADKPFGMASMIGIILLMGLVTKNSILLVDYCNQLRREGKAMREALVHAGVTRLRPILMTSAAIVLGMLPSALSTAEGSEFQQPMSIGVIGGVITSTLLTLVVVPVVYVWLDRITLRGFKEWRAERRARKQAAATA